MMKNIIVKKLICLLVVVNVAWSAFTVEDELFDTTDDSLVVEDELFDATDYSLAIIELLGNVDGLLAISAESLATIGNEFPLARKNGWVLGLRADFFGALTLPDISEATLKYMNPKAVGMMGTLSNLLMGGEVEIGYIFKSPMKKKDSAFSGIGVYGYLGMGQGNASQKISAIENGEAFDIFMIVDYLPVVNFGIKGKALFFDNRFSVGLGVGGKAILDTSPSYLVYSTMPDIIPTEIGTIIVTEEMMKKMNPLALSLRFEMSYAIPVLPTTEIVIGWFTAYNFFSPKYLTMPPSLLNIAQANRPGATDTPPSPLLDFDQAFPDYWINSLEFGINIGLVFKL